MTEWVNIKDRMPEPWKTVLLWDNDMVQSGYMNDAGEYINHIWGAPVKATHWLMMPEPPGGEGEG